MAKLLSLAHRLQKPSVRARGLRRGTTLSIRDPHLPQRAVLRGGAYHLERAEQRAPRQRLVQARQLCGAGHWKEDDPG